MTPFTLRIFDMADPSEGARLLRSLADRLDRTGHEYGHLTGGTPVQATGVFAFGEAKFAELLADAS